MTEQEINRLKSIYSDLSQQLMDGTPPIMILASIGDDDIDFLRSNLELVCWGFESGQIWGRLLLVYSIIDYVYEQYAQDTDENTNLWPLVIKYLSKYIKFTRQELVDVVHETLTDERYHLPSESSGKPYLNTVLLNSSSKHYSGRFFDFIMGQYSKNLDKDVEFDLKDVALSISQNFEEDRIKVNQMSHSFGLMIKNPEIFPDIFDRVINKIDQRSKSLVEYDLGRWETAFDDWYSDINSSKLTRNKAEILLESHSGEYYLVVNFPSNRGVPKGYYAKLSFGKESSIVKFSVISKKGINHSFTPPLKYPVQNIPLFDNISAKDSTDVDLADVAASDYRFFNTSGKMVNAPSSGQYKVLIRHGVDYDLPELYNERISDDVVLIFTKLEKGCEYHIGKDTIRSEEHISKNNLSIRYPTTDGRSIICADRPNVIPEHPTILVDGGIEAIRVSLKDYAGRYLYNDPVTPIDGQIDINDLTESRTGAYTLVLSYEKYRLANVRYLVIDGIGYSPDIKVANPSSGQLSIISADGSKSLPYTPEDMYAYDTFTVNGKPFKCGFRTPNIFFNPCSDRDGDLWISAGCDTFDTNELGSTIGISIGCACDSEDVALLIRSPMGSVRMNSKIDQGVCYFRISDEIQYIQSKKYHFGLELQYEGKLYPLFQVQTKGKYDVDICNDLAIITPYKMPSGCYARYEYHSFSENRAGYLNLNNPELFDLGKPCTLIVTETNTDTNDEIIIFKKKSSVIKRPNLSSTIEKMKPYDRAQYLLAGNGCDIDVYTALDILKDLASKGNLRALYQLGTIYLNGQIVTADLQKAADYFGQYLSERVNLDFVDDSDSD